MDYTQFHKVLKEYMDVCHELFGFYFDTSQGFANNIVRLDSGKNPNEDENAGFSYVNGNPGEVGHYIIYRSTIKEFRERHADDGPNAIKAFQNTIVLIYTYWDSEFRQKIADSLQVHKNDISLDIMGEIMLWRHDIVHHRGIPTEEKQKRYKFYSMDKVVYLDAKDMQEFPFFFKENFDNYSIKISGFDPKFRIAESYYVDPK